MAQTNLVNLIGTIVYTIQEGEQWKAAMIIDDNQVEKLRNKCKELFPNYDPIAPAYVEDDKAWKVYIKSRYSIKVIDEASQPVTEPVVKGAEIIARCSIAEYQYMKKKGLTLYVNAILLKKNGEVEPLTADSFND